MAGSRDQLPSDAPDSPPGPRAGLQPVVVLGDGGRLPPSAAEIVVRLVWGYRSELAPFLAAGAVFLAGWWAHLSTPHWYPCFIVGSATAAWLVITFGAWLGLPRLADRAYAGVTVFAAGGWVAFAALFGSLTPPLPLVLGVVTLISGIPWWADRRRRARARVLRAIAAWPDVAGAIGLPGSVIQSVSVDTWGWRAWLRLAYGQTVTDVTARIPAIESALGTVHGAVHVFPHATAKPAGAKSACSVPIRPSPRKLTGLWAAEWSGQRPNSSTVWLTAVNPAAAATFSAHCSTTRPSTSTLRPHSRQVRWWWCAVESHCRYRASPDGSRIVSIAPCSLSTWRWR